MLVLKIVGLLLGGVLLLLIILVFFILVSRVRIDFRGKNGEKELRIGIGPFRIQILPPPKAPAKEETQPKEVKKPKKKTKKKAKASRRPDFSAIQYGDVLTTVLDLLMQMKDRLILEVFLLNVVFASDNAAKTGLLLGGASATAGMIVPFLEQNFNVEKLQANFSADFKSNQTKWAVAIVFAARPGSALRILLKNRREIHAIYKQIIWKEEAI